MTDQELIMLAALAAGYELAEFNGLKSNHKRYIPELGCIKAWNPLTDDGDALRLAVRIGAMYREPFRISIEFQSDGDQDYTVIEHKGETVFYHDKDPSAATRRAIVLAAAEIGKTSNLLNTDDL